MPALLHTRQQAYKYHSEVQQTNCRQMCYILFTPRLPYKHLHLCFTTWTKSSHTTSRETWSLCAKQQNFPLAVFHRTCIQTQELQIASKYVLILVKKCEKHNNLEWTHYFSRLVFRNQNNTCSFYLLNRAQLWMLSHTGNTGDAYSSLAQTQGYSSPDMPCLAKPRHNCLAGRVLWHTTTCLGLQLGFSCGLEFCCPFSGVKWQNTRSSVPSDYYWQE